MDEALGGLPLERAYCAALAIGAMRDGLAKATGDVEAGGEASSPVTKDR